MVVHSRHMGGLCKEVHMTTNSNNPMWPFSTIQQLGHTLLHTEGFVLHTEDVVLHEVINGPNSHEMSQEMSKDAARDTEWNWPRKRHAEMTSARDAEWHCPMERHAGEASNLAGRGPAIPE